MLLITFVIILASAVEGDQRIAYVSELVSNIFPNNESNSNFTCCEYENCSCMSLDIALANLTSNVLINITTNVTLSSLINMSDLENISIIGYDNPTVKCRNIGGIHFTYCHNCIFKGITWDGCSKEYKNHWLKLSYSSNILIQNCLFQHSIGQVVVLLKSQNVTISKCMFLSNKNVCIHVINQSLYLIGNILFKSNTAKNGSGIYISDHSTIIFYENSNVTFFQNSAIKGAAIFLRNNSSILFDHNTTVLFNENNADNGTIFSEACSRVTFVASCKVTFNNNSADCGAAIYSSYKSHVTFMGSSIVTFSNNQNLQSGTIWSFNYSQVYFKGNSLAVFCNNVNGSLSTVKGNISFEENSSAKFYDNSANEGGAINMHRGTIYFKESSFTRFCNNYAHDGGAIYLIDRGAIHFAENSTTNFVNNIALRSGGAIYSGHTNNIYFENNSTTTFNNNKANDDGGVMLLLKNYAYFRGNSFTFFNNNTANKGGVIYTFYSKIIFSSKATTEFRYSAAMQFGPDGYIVPGDGAAIYSVKSFIVFGANSFTLFHYNIADDCGGALLIKDHSFIRFSYNSTVTFNNNEATSGAIIYSFSTCRIMVTGNPTVIINDLPAKWCNGACMPTGYSNDVFLIDSNGIAWCSSKETFTCQSKKCLCKKLVDKLSSHKMYVTVHLYDTVLLSSFINLVNARSRNFKAITIIGHNKLTVLCVNGGGLFLRNCDRLIVEGVTWVGCGDFQPVVHIYRSVNVTIKNCSFENSMGAAIEMSNVIGNVNISDCNFMNNHFKDHGVGIKYTSVISPKTKYPLTINNCNFSHNGVIKSNIYIKIGGNVYFNTHIYIINSNFYDNKGVSIYVPLASDKFKSSIHIIGIVLFKNIEAMMGAGIYLESNTVIFDKGSLVKFISNSVKQCGAAIFSNITSNIIFENNSRVEFNNNKATYGTIYSNENSIVIFTAACHVIFSGNSVTQYGAAIYSSDNSHVTFTGNSEVMFNNNVVSSYSKDLQFGGNIFSKNHSRILFDENSVTTFTNNSADFGAAIFSLYSSTISFKGRSRIMFINNSAYYCGILTSALYSSVDFKDTAKVVYNNNTISGILYSNYESPKSAGTLCTFIGANVIFSGHSLTRFINNRAVIGGAAVFSDSNVIMESHATVTVNNNVAEYLYGGAFVCLKNSAIIFKDNSYTVFHSNKASQSAGAIHNCNITFKDNSVAEFIENSAVGSGGAIVGGLHSEIIFKGNTTVNFVNNTADNGGVFHIINSVIIFTDSSTILFFNNIAQGKGGVGYFSVSSKVFFEGFTSLRFVNNIAKQSAGVLYSAYSHIWFKSNSRLALSHNAAIWNGGAFYFDSNSSVTFSQFTYIKIYSNTASYGGGILANDHSSITITGNSVLSFVNNSAAQYGGAVFLDITTVIINNCSSKNCIHFKANVAKVLGNSLYQNMAQLCNKSCLNSKVVGINNKFIATPPKELKFSYPASCIDNDSTQCNNYYIQNIMLGTEIVLPACVFDYYNHSVDSTQFLLQSKMHPYYSIIGPKQVLISCNTFEGISIIGNHSLTKTINFSINITLNAVFNPNWRSISVNLIIELSPCHLGFWQYPQSLKCECYNATDIVFCSDTSSTIKRGYWFGSVAGKPTVTLCPINYCNFTCCETSNGYYQLSPIRDNQCRSHRTGTACGRCTTGYTLSFDSPECIRVQSCTAGKTVLVILLALAYWIIIVALVFAMMYYKVGICYLYSITYYYSIVDILINQNLQASRRLSISVNVISSFSKITPQFLGELCLTNGMSGIDQQFIHYIHPSAIIVILVIITLSARRSKRISNIIRRGIIHVICLLLLLSYTSMASTSLLLMRPLKFHDIDKVYTYLSPDIEYFHGRHLAYSIVALLCAISIVIGLPLLIILEPFLNRKINFIKIKPLLDQFQGSYKDKCRCFAGYYMICRLLIIVIVIANSSNDFITSYILITVCGIVALIHQTIKPYGNNKILNKFDGLILQLLILVAALSLLENLRSPFVSFALITLPLLIFIAMTLFLNRCNLKKIFIYFINKIESAIASNNFVRITNNDASNDNEMREFKTIIVDDNKRKNAIICDV